jgi:hypothetical protein
MTVSHLIFTPSVAKADITISLALVYSEIVRSALATLGVNIG